MKDIHAPYNFVPVSETVARDWGDALPSQDAPYEDGLCGEIALTLIAETPLLVAGEQPCGEDSGKDATGEKRFAMGKDGKPEIPGSSIKGMVRAVVEIASFSAMTLIEDRRFGLRDLSGSSADSYRRKFQHHGDGEGKSLGGWLRRADAGGGSGDGEISGWVIEPCQVERYHHDRFKGAFADAFRRVQRQKKLEQKEAPQIYAAWKQAHDKDWRKALQTESGELVFTGNPSPKKRKEFLFKETGAAPMPVPEAIWSGFIDVHERQEKPSGAWMWWKKRLELASWDKDDSRLPQEPADRIPVFYLHDGAQVIGLGLAQMFKFSGVVSTREALPHAHREGADNPDLATRLFGRIVEDGGGSFRGRVAFAAGRLGDVGWDVNDGEWGETVSSGPKPGFHPAYLRQPAPQPGRRRSYVTWADEGAQLRGWKRYPAQEQDDYRPPKPPKDSSPRSRSRLFPIVSRDGEEPLRFSTKLRVHNLRPFELGALLWALDFGGDVESRHALGMGKPFGWGRVRLETGRARLAANTPGEKTPELDRCREAFAHEMGKRITGWANSKQLSALKAMARPSADPSLRSMRLDPPNRVNEFQDARNAGAVLPPPVGVDDWLPAAPRGPRTAAHTPPPTVVLLREGDEVRDLEMGDFGVVVEDQGSRGADVLVDFEGAQEWMPAKTLERR